MRPFDLRSRTTCYREESMLADEVAIQQLALRVALRSHKDSAVSPRSRLTTLSLPPIPRVKTIIESGRSSAS
jgi:hypothetical protein